MVRKYENETKNLEEAIIFAINECINRNILKEFLQAHSSEVRNMVFTEWNTEEAKIVWKQEGREEGIEIGREIGREEGKEKGREETLKKLEELIKQGVPATEALKKLSRLRTNH